MASILLVDDVMVVRMTLRKFLERGGHTVQECDNGLEAIGHLNSGRFDVVLTDIWMPGGNGVDLIRTLKETGIKTRVIAITGGAPRAPQEYSMEEAQKAGADGVLLKPVTKDELLSAVAAVMELRT
ncbi:response regulator [Magnetospirillum molischianum]|uniref:Putative two-component response transcriptional regulator (CheY family) n=1 Tax=Magnetospirillum molischianum DSM 120 TaxID=1150626 RepID=H8FVG7_MAGML|nr:response regulator [Magnetospirillum molischianum]CCG42355.1 Putative two-component response transcriptional regulator (CheY family) [Magnetospirillum molischianum DSM 120]